MDTWPVSTAAPRVLVLAGTTEARQLVEQVAAQGRWETVASFAGRTSSPLALPGAVRTGGFGGISGLERYVVAERIGAVVDATHPFAAVMPHHVHAACASLGVSALRLLRPAWEPVAGDHWVDAEDVADAARRIRSLGARRVLLTSGRQELLPFVALTGVHFVVRTIEPIDPGLFTAAVALRERGPFDFDRELALLREHRIDAIVSKNSGGEATRAKLEAARELAVPVVMVRRPAGPPARTVPSVAEAVRWLAEA
jgi:precorrin-6A/cobalt-precorrin-6A reductase